MSDLEKNLKDLMYCGIGAVATAVDKGSELCKTFVEKGQEAMEQGRTCGEELKRRAKETIDQCTKVEIDVSKLTPEQRVELRRQLDLMDQEDASASDDGHENG